MQDWLTGYAAFHWIATWSHPVLDVFFRAVTDLGYPLFYYLVIAPLIWVVDRRRGMVLFLLLLLAALMNSEAKLWADTPRPDPSLVRVLDLRPLQSGSRSFPSGHAQIAVVFWGYLALWVRRRWFTVLAVALIAAISFSRIYLAAHFPFDVVGGLVLGAALFAVVPWLDRWAAADFGAPVAVRALVGLVTASAMLVSADAGVVTVLGCLLALLVLFSLPPPRMSLSGVPQAALVVLVGVAIQAVCAGLFGQFSGQVDLSSGFRVAALWLIALWLYPQGVAAVLARRQVATERA
jgi:membrane-associated phospholipid phosphatase